MNTINSIIHLGTECCAECLQLPHLQNMFNTCSVLPLHPRRSHQRADCSIARRTCLSWRSTVNILGEIFFSGPFFRTDSRWLTTFGPWSVLSASLLVSVPACHISISSTLNMPGTGKIYSIRTAGLCELYTESVTSNGGWQEAGCQTQSRCRSVLPYANVPLDKRVL